MNLADFLDHWRLIENPFRGEEARHDSVFARMASLAAPGAGTVLPVAIGGPVGVGAAGAGASGAAVAQSSSTATPRAGAEAALKPTLAVHSDFEKILGDPRRPSSAIVFGEKGSGKTAIRLQIQDRIERFNARHPDARTLLVPYDDLNPILDHYVARQATAKLPAEQALSQLRQVDHLDAMLSLVVPRLIDAVLGPPAGAGASAAPGAGAGESARGAARAGVGAGPASGADPESPPATLGWGVDLGPEPRKAARKMDGLLRRELCLLQALYDRPEQAAERTALLRRALRLPRDRGELLWDLASAAGWIPAAVLAGWSQVAAIGGQPTPQALWYVVLALLAAWAAVLVKRQVWDRLALRRLGKRARKQLRTIARPEASLAASLGRLDPLQRDEAHLPLTDSDQPRYALVQALRRVLAHFGYRTILVVVDRIDEPTVIRGDPERMRAVVWPMLHNKFLQQEGIGFKLLLPIDLRHALFKESSAFFQEARLDKQNLVERLSWTGAMLYDLCDARLAACRPPAAGPITLLDLFAEDVSRQDLVDALDQMHQPRDAFKFLYHLMSEHCSNVTAQQQQFRIPRLVLETVRKQQSERVQQLYRGIRPA